MDLRLCEDGCALSLTRLLVSGLFMDCKLDPLFVARTSCLRQQQTAKVQNAGTRLTQIDTCLSYKCVTCVTIGVAVEINELGAIMSSNSHLGTLLARGGISTRNCWMPHSQKGHEDEIETESHNRINSRPCFCRDISALQV